MNRLPVLGGIAVLAVTALGAGLVTPASSQSPATSPASAHAAARPGVTTTEMVTAASRIPAKRVVLTVGRTKVRATTQMSTAAELLQARGIDVGPRDIVKVAPGGTLRTGSRVTVVRVKVVLRSKSNTLGIPVVKRQDSRLTQGTTVLVRKGKPGLVRRIYQDLYRNGVLQRSTLVSKKVVTGSTAKIVRVGTKPAASRSSARAPLVGGEADSMNWTALAKCESGGQADIVSSNGLYYGLYQFLPSTWRAVGGTGLPNQATPAEQTYRAKLLYKSQGRAPWPYCGRFL